MHCYCWRVLVIAVFLVPLSFGASLDDREHDSVPDMLPLADRPEFPEELNTTKCGGVLVAKGGFINYKQAENYSNNERCIWTIRSDKWQTSFQMRQSDFHSTNDRLAIYVINDSGILERKAQIDSKTGNNIIGVIGPTVFLVLTTDQIGTGKGFILEYFGFGYNELSGYHYEHSHLTSPSGDVTWPKEPLKEHKNIFSTFILMPRLLIPDSDVALSVDKVDLMSLVRGCDHNSFSVHQLYQNGFAVRLRYCEADFIHSAKISSSSPLIITYITTMGPKQTGIGFTWNTEQPDTNLVNIVQTNQ